LAGFNGPFIESLYAAYLENPTSVDPDWAQFFASLGDEDRHVLRDLLGASWAPRERSSVTSPSKVPFMGAAGPAIPASAISALDHSQILDTIRAIRLIRAYRVRGHLAAHLDPLHLENTRNHPELDPATYGFGPEDYNRPIFIDGSLGLSCPTLTEILEVLKRTYADTIGIEFMHIQDPDAKLWLQKKAESRHEELSLEGKKEVLQSLDRAEGFEQFLAKKYPGAKRFGLEGGESTIPALDFLLSHAGRHGIKDVVLGMAHRGRLNVLVNILGKLPRAVFSEFQGKAPGPEDMQGSGDVKYHLGASADRTFGDREIHLSLTANPSHLEAVNPVVVGKVRAKQSRLKDHERRQVMGILLHGDAAFSGQGLVAETLLLSDLGGYRTGGTIHLIVNNQIGFTTLPNFSRSSPYSSDISKMIQAPVFHVNGDDPEAVVWAAQVALEFKQTFQKDVVIDLFCYRRHGHNEMDEPSFTQPLMYKAIRSKETTRSLYAKNLVEKGDITQEEADTFHRQVQSSLAKEFELAKDFKNDQTDWLEGAWSGIETSFSKPGLVKTGVPKETLLKIGKGLTATPRGFNLHRKLVRLMDQKKEMFESGKGFDWATGEALAFASLLLEGFPVRLSGQDSGRGTFSQRHAVLVDQETAAPYVPMNSIQDEQAELEVVDSPLAEASVLGFELGYTLADPNALVMWEAQFGDFANGAQVIFDQFIAAGETKWLRMSGIVMLLPHGYEGQGPEHSSARMERYLQACAEDNIQVANCTTPANYFHILRRQLVRKTRKPLIIMTPKSLLRDKRAVSTLDDMSKGTTFQEVLPEVNKNLVPDRKVKRVIICSGKVYYDLVSKRDESGLKDVAIIRLEQLYPFPEDQLKKEFARYSAAQFIWCQEEPENMGAWTFVDRRLENVLISLKHKHNRPLYVGRQASASTATGLLSHHLKQQDDLVNNALGINNKGKK
tara:strand:+ start:1332 stop:4181 length:2850 start_codon:yes stop_codon:yes gene_type:complete